MSQTGIRKGDGGTAALSPATMQAFRASVRGATCLPGEPGYEEARTIWNAMIDRRPALIVRAAGAADVIASVNLAREHGLVFAIRGGGHNIAGNAVCDGGLMLDLSLMKSVRVDPAAKRVRVEPGATLGDVDGETQAFGLALPVGINSTTGIAGLTLGGGFGWLSRQHGLTIDNLLSVDVVTADGRLLHASGDENPDLFWAVRGGGGNFGVVTSFEFRLHPTGPEVLAGLVVHPLMDGRHLLAQYRQIAANASDKFACWVVMRKAPPLPFLPAEVHGTHVLVFAMCYAGDLEEGRKAVAPILSLGKPVGTHVGPMPFKAWQAAFDPLLTAGARNYWKSHDFTSLSNETIDVLLDYAGRVPTPQSEVFIAQLGGAVNRVPTEATAYPHRDVEFVVNVHTRWDDASQDQGCIAWTRAFFDAAAPHATGGVYVNFMPDDEAGRVHTGAYGPNYDRLAALKRKYDPANLFRLNQNINPGKTP
jgi:FAD/FMN-containing dehydrogenase